MKTALFYSTAATGEPSKQASNHASQPHIVHLLACLVDIESRDVVSTLDLILRPKFKVPVESTAVNGFSEDMADRFGVTTKRALTTFMGMWGKSQVRVAHNEPLHAKLIRIALARTSDDSQPISELWLDGEATCTMAMSHPFTATNMPPSLAEASKLLLDQELEPDLSPMQELTACMALYFHCAERRAAA